MPKVRFNLKDASGLILLKYRYRRGGLPFVYSFNRHCPPEFWDHRTMRVKNTARFPQGRAINELLQHLENELMSYHDRLIVQNVQPDRKMFRRFLNEKTFKNVPEKVTLFSYIQTIIDRRSANAKTNKVNTLNNFKGLLKVLKRYSKDINFDDITFAWLHDFEQWCYEGGYSVATVGKFVALTKTTINLARKEGHTTNRVVLERGFSVSAPEGNKMVLYLDELEQIEKIQWDQVTTFEGMTRERLEKVADIIIAGCWTGLRHSDLNRIKPTNIKTHNGQALIEINTKKTDTPVAVPVFPALANVLQKRDGKLPTADRSEVLRVGRKVLKLAGVNSVFHHRSTAGGGLSVKPVPKYSKFSSHVLRRSFATNAYLLGLDVKIIMQITGHKTEQQFMDYVNFGKWLTVQKMASIDEYRQKLAI